MPFPVHLPLARPVAAWLRRWSAVAGLALAVAGSATAQEAAAEERGPWLSYGRVVAQRYPTDRTGVAGRARLIQQLPDHRMAVATERGLFLFDGQRWEDVAGFSGLHSLVTATDGRFFLGSGSEVYELTPDGLGGYASRPRSNGLLRDRPDSIVFSLARLDGVVYGIDGNRMIIMPDGGEPEVVPLPTWGDGLFTLEGALYLRANAPEEQLRRYDAATRTFTSAVHLMPANVRELLVAQATDPSGAVWLATEGGRIFRTDGRTAVLLPAILEEAGRALTVDAIQPLPQGGVAVATVERGLLLVEADGTVRERPLGLHGAGIRIYSLGADGEGGLWAGGALELFRVDGWLRSSLFGETEGLVGEVWATARLGGRLYVGTDAGLFVQNPSAGSRGEAFVQLEGVPPVNSLLATPDGLWVGAQHLLLLRDPESIRHFGPAIRDPNPLVQPRGRPDMLLVGTGDGLSVLHRVEGQWDAGQAVPGVDRQVFSMAQTDQGDVWLSFGTGAAGRMRWRAGGWEVQSFGEAEGIPNLWVHFGVLGNDVYLGTDRGTLVWDEAAGRFVPTTRMIYYGVGEPFGFDPIFSNDDGVWIWPQPTIGTLVPRTEAATLAEIATSTGHIRARSRTLYRDPDGVAWIGLPAGLLRFEPVVTPPVKLPDVQLRRMRDARTGQPIRGGLLHEGTIELPYHQNSIRIEAALPRYFGDRFSQFLIELQGFDDGAPRTVGAPSREYTNLAPGRYQLHLHAWDGMNRAARPLTLGLVVHAPFYTTWWAYTVYALLGAGAVAGIIRWRVTVLRRQALALQAAVDERTAELSRQSTLLQEEKELFVSLAAAAPVGIWRGDAEGAIVLVNAALETISGRTRGRLLQEGWWPTVHPDDRAKAEDLMAAAARERRAVSGELRFQRPSGEARWVLVGLAPVRAPAEGASWLVGTALDVTERREVERRMMRAQRLESIGTLTGGIAHDLNNALVPIVAGISLLSDERSPDRHALLGDIERSAKRAAGMVRQLLAFARGMDGQRVPVDLVVLLRELRGLLERTLPKNLVQQYDCGDGIGWVQGDPTQLHQVLLNLCLNARDAMPQGGELSLRLHTEEPDQVEDAFGERIRPGLYRVVTVRDTGSGIPPEALDHIFDPFFTTKAPDRGTGLGLSTSLGIVRSHGGHFVVQTSPGLGTRFSLYLPAVPAPAEAAAAPKQETLAPVASGVVALVVDDEVTVRAVLQRSLTRLGLRPLVAADGPEALELWRRHREDVELLVVDLHMPGMDGIAVIRAVRAEAPLVPIIVTSGNSTDDQRRHLQELGVPVVLPKPFALDELAAAVRKVLACVA